LLSMCDTNSANRFPGVEISGITREHGNAE
jgi:hypothetical protein